MSDLPPSLSERLAARGVAAGGDYRVLASLADGRWWSPRELVRATAVANRTVEELLAALGPWVEREGGRVRLTPEAADGLGDVDRPRPADPVGHLLADHEDARRKLERLIDEAPAPRPDLDHVSATAGTAVRRALLLRTWFALSGARLLCVGDHDLTAVAATLVCPDLAATVVDVDERMLDHIDRAARHHGLPIDCHFADLRLGMPAATRAVADVAFTDPPYTPAGVELFVRRAVEGLAAPKRGRVVLAYGASETTPVLTARTQAGLTKLGLAFEAIWPGFNHYHGAEAIGASSDLYVTRPTSRTPTRVPAEAGARLYSRGANARERSSDGLDTVTARAIVETAGTEAVDTVVGEWPRGVGVADRTRHTRLATWLASPNRAHYALVNLIGGWEHSLGRVILASGAERVDVAVAGNAVEVHDAEERAWLRALVALRYTVRFRRYSPEVTVVEARRAARTTDDAPAARLLDHCADRPHGVVANSLREGLIALAGDRGRVVTKRWARDRTREAAPWLAGHTLLDTPRHRVVELPDVARALVRTLDVTDGGRHA